MALEEYERKRDFKKTPEPALPQFFDSSSLSLLPLLRCRRQP